MKNLENMKIAVCFVGQSRTYEHCADSINSFFSSAKGNEFYFFGHTWDTNTYKYREGNNIVIHQEDNLDIPTIRQGLESKLKFEKLIVEHEIYRPQSWASVFYSTMKSNFLKQMYEVENNMMFDLVIKARFDVCYHPGHRFEDFFHHVVMEKTLYSNFGHMNMEFFLPNPDDVLYFGTSLTMDLVDSLFTGLKTGEFNKEVGLNTDNPTYNHVGPGILIYKWAAMKNIMPVQVIVPHAVFRKQAKHLVWPKDWNKIKHMSGMIF
jgi:hypothetical protein